MLAKVEAVKVVREKATKAAIEVADDLGFRVTDETAHRGLGRLIEKAAESLGYRQELAGAAAFIVAACWACMKIYAPQGSPSWKDSAKRRDGNMCEPGYVLSLKVAVGAQVQREWVTVTTREELNKSYKRLNLGGELDLNQVFLDGWRGETPGTTAIGGKTRLICNPTFAKEVFQNLTALID